MADSIRVESVQELGEFPMSLKINAYSTEVRVGEDAAMAELSLTLYRGGRQITAELQRSEAETLAHFLEAWLRELDKRAEAKT